MNQEEKIFSLQGKGLKLSTKQDIQPYLDQLSKKQGLERVVLGGNTLGVEAAQALGETLAGVASDLLELDAADIFTGRLRPEIPPALVALLDAVKHAPKLHTLDLSDNAFGPAGAEPLSNFLAKSSSLRVFRVNNTGLGPEGGRLIAKALTDLAKHCQAAGIEPGLRVFHAGRNRLQNESCAALKEALEGFSNVLEDFRVYQNGIRSEGVLLLLEALSNCPSLTHLDLQDNTFTERGAVALAKALANWPQLREVNFADCMPGVKGGRLLCAALGTLTKLQVVNLSYDELDDKALLSLAVAMRNWPQLQTLSLNGNQFPAEGAGLEAVRQALVDLGKEDGVLDSLSDLESDTNSHHSDHSDHSGHDEEEEAGELKKLSLQ